MPSLIQRIPAGFLSALGIKGTGENPRDLGDGVAATYDMQAMYTAERIEGVTLTASVTAVADGVSIPVPQGETWRLLALSGEWFNGTTANVIRYFVGVRFSGTGQNIRVFHSDKVTIAATERVTIGGFIPLPMVLPPGSELRAQLSLTQANAATLRLSAAIERLAI